MPRKSNHAYSTSISGSASLLLPEVDSDQKEGKTAPVASTATGTLALVLILVLASLGFSAQGITAARKDYIPTRDYILSQDYIPTLAKDVYI